MNRVAVTRAALAASLSILAAIACRKKPAPPPSETVPPAPAVEAAPAPPVVSPPAATVEQFAALEVAWAGALARKDSAALARLVAPEFLITGVGSTATDPVGGREEWLRNAGLYPWPEHAVRDVRLAAASSDTVVVKCLWSGDYPPQSLTPEGGLVELLVTDVWTLRDGAWVVVARHSSLPRPE